MLVSFYAEKAEAVPYWLREGSYAEYLIANVHLNNCTIIRGELVYGWNCTRKTPEYAFLEAYLKKRDGRTVMSTHVQVDLASKNLIDPELGTAWGKCLFWIDPWDMGTENVVMMFNWTGQTLYANVSLQKSQQEIPAGFETFKTPFRDFEETQMCGMGFIQLPYPPESDVSGYFLVSFRYDVKSGLAIGGFYLDDILHNRFEILHIIGGIAGYKYQMLLLDTNIFDIKEENPDYSLAVLGAGLVTCVAVPTLVFVWRKKRRG